MSDGGRESARGNQTSSNSKKGQQQSRGDEFGRAVSKIAVAQICETAGFHCSHRSALDALAEVAVRYIFGLGKSASFYANLAGRTSCSVFDIIQGLEDLSSAQGFLGAFDVKRCLMSSGVVREISQFVSTGKEIPFTRPIPSFPVARLSKPVISFAQVGEVPAGKHIPDWLPKLPDPRTYVHAPVWSERDADAKTDKVEQARQRRKAERSLLSLQQRLACNGSAGFVPSNYANVGKGKQVVGDNPFIAPPLPYGEKVVSEIAVPNEAASEKRLSVLETFAPAFEAAKVGSLDFNINERRILCQNRPTVHFKIGLDKKSVAASLFANPLNAIKDSWSLSDDEKDEKKRRAEMILKEAMEKPHDLTQL